jgi:hypothetical protein
MTKYILFPYYNIPFDKPKLIQNGGYINNFFKYEKIDKPPHIMQHHPRIIAIGDIHGDFKLLLNCLRLANVIDSNNNWNGNNTIVVQVGDQIDNCRDFNNCIHHTDDTPHDIEILIYMYKLNKQAKKSGGAVYSLLGNHEIMNIEGDMRYVSYQNILKFGNNFNSGLANRIKYFNIGSEMTKMLGYTRHTGIIIGDLLFVHAGVLPILAKKFNISNINRLIRSWVLGSKTNSKLVHMIKDNLKISPFWIRLFGEIDANLDSNDNNCKKINDTLSLYKLKGMVIGHTPQFFPNNLGINSTCGNKLWRVDFGGSNGFNNFDNGKFHKKRKPQVLEILDDMSNNHILTYNILS